MYLKTTFCFGVLTAISFVPWGPVTAAPGSLDTTFGATGVIRIDTGELYESGNAMALQSDGKIVLAGSVAFTAIRCNADGTLDTSFNGTGISSHSPSGGGVAAALAIQSDGKMVMAGGGYDSFSVMRLLANGSLDTSFNGTGSVTKFFASGLMTCEGCAVQSDGKIVIVGFSRLSPTGQFMIIRYNVDGTPDTTFSGDGVLDSRLSSGRVDEVHAVTIQSDGKILVAGSSGARGIPASKDMLVARYNADGTPDTTWGGAGWVLTGIAWDDVAYSVKVLSDGRVLVGGQSNADYALSPRGGRFAAVRHNSDGSLDTSFNGTGWAEVDFESSSDCGFSAVEQINGRIVIAGVWNHDLSDGMLAVTRLNHDGTLDNTFGNLGRVTTSLGGTYHPTGFKAAVQFDGKILVAGTAKSPVNGFDFVMVRYEGDPFPEIALEQPIGNPRQDGISSVDFGEATAATPTSKIFKVKNTGGGVLNLQGVTFSGPDAAAFSVSSAPAATVSPITGSTQFTVKFTGGMAGPKSAIMHIASNDQDEASFEVNLSGTALFTVALGGTCYVAKEVDGTVAIPVLRTGGGTIGGVTPKVSTVGGTASGGDFQPLASQDVPIADGLGSANVSITITYADAVEGNETFTISLDPPASGSGYALGSPSSATVVILDSEDNVKPPTPVISSPKEATRMGVVVGGMITVTGTASDNQNVAGVEVSLDGVNYSPAAVTLTGTGAAHGKTATYTGTVQPVTGSNRLYVRTVDQQNHKSDTPAVRNFVALRPLLVGVSGAAGSVSTGFAPESPREVGTLCTIKAIPATTPAPGSVFDGWVVSGGPSLADIGVSAAALELPTLTFTMREGLTLTAKFITNPFDDEKGVYNGLVRASLTAPNGGPTPPSQATEGHLNVTLQPSGGFSGKLTMDGLVLNVSGTFDNEGKARFGTTRADVVSVTRPGKPGLRLRLQLQDLEEPPTGTGADDRITGTVTHLHRTTITAVSDIVAERATVPADILAYVPAPATSALFTAIMDPQAPAAQPAVLTTEDYPQSTGFASITVSKTGAVTFTGTLADGTTPVSLSSTLSKDGDSPLFVQLYNKLGFLSGLLHLDINAESDMSAEGMLWSRPYQDTQHYRFGWPEVIKVDLDAARYTVPPGNSVLLAPDNTRQPDDVDSLPDYLRAPDLVNGNAEVRFFELPSALIPVLTKAVNLSTTDAVTKLVTDANFTLSVVRNTGRISGSFQRPGDLSKPTYQGIIYQKGLAPGAYGFFLTTTPKVKTYDGQSGTVKLTAK